MPLLTFTSASPMQEIGPLAADTDFQLRDGSCLVATEDPGSDLDAGFERAAHGDHAEFFVASGKTVYLWTTGRCVLFYGSLV